MAAITCWVLAHRRLVAAFWLIVAVPTTFLPVWGVTAVTDVSFIVEFLTALIGLGIAIDYSLLIIIRWREERAQGHANALAVERAMATAGRAVIFSGATVAISLLTLVVLPVPFLRSVGYGGLLIPLVTVAVAMTLLPALLATVGPRLEWPRRTYSAQPSPFWTSWTRGVARRRWMAAGAALLILGALLIPLGSLKLGDPSADALASTGPAYHTLQTLETSGIGNGALDPIEVLTTGRAPKERIENR